MNSIIIQDKLIATIYLYNLGKAGIRFYQTFLYVISSSKFTHNLNLHKIYIVYHNRAHTICIKLDLRSV